MQVLGISSRVARAILAANRQVAAGDVTRIPQLGVDGRGQLRVLDYAMNECRPWEPLPEDFGQPATGLTWFTTVETWHPVRAGNFMFARMTVVQVLAQLEDDVREQVAAIQFLDYVVSEVVHRDDDAEDMASEASDGWYIGWAIKRTRLYRRGLQNQISGRVVGHAKDTSLEDATFRLPDGRTKVVAIVQRPAAVAVVPMRLSENGQIEVLLVRQPRPAVGEEALVEIVAGKIDGDDDALTTAKRELGEEVGLTAEEWTPLGSNLLPAPGFLREPIHLFAAHNLTAVESREEDAHITGEWVLLTEAVGMVLDDTIRDIKAIVALLKVDKLHRGWAINA